MLLFLDEATSALDEPTEAQLYTLLRAPPWRPTVVSVGHRKTLLDFHDARQHQYRDRPETLSK